MAEDRGGLRYPIEAVDAFSAPFRAFISTVDDAGKAWDRFRGIVKKSAGAGTSAVKEAEAATRRQAQAVDQAAAATDRQARASKRNAQALSEEEKQLKRLETAAKKRAAIEKIQQSRPDLFPTKEKGGGFERARQATVEEQAQKKVADALRRKEVAERAAAVAAERGVAISKEKARALTVEEALLKRLEAAAARRAAVEKLQQTRPDLFAPKAGAGGARGAAFDAPTVPTISEAAQTSFQKQLRALQVNEQVEALKKLSPEYARLAEAQERASRTTNSLFFTFRRLIGVFAAFAAIRAVASGFQQAVAGAISFQAALEQTRIGIASLILSSNRLVDSQGRELQGQEALAAARSIASQQLELLRRDALKTAATFEELSFAFQVALAPGAKAGLQVDQIRQLTVRVSQAASALGIAQNQLSEEIRAILTGQVDPRTTRLGVIPGLDNESIKRAQTAGKLAEFLEQKLFAFGLAADVAQQNFAVLASNLQEAFSLAGAEGSLSLFEELKRLLQDVSRLLVTDVGNAITPNSQVVQAISEVASGLRTGVVEARRLVAALSAQDLINIARSIGQAFSVAFSLLGPVVEGLVRALGNVAGVLNPLLAGLGLVAEGSSGILATLVEWYVYYRLSSAALDGMVVKTGLLGKSTGAVLLNVAKIAAFLGAFLVPLGAAQKAIKSFTGDTLSLKNTIANLALGFAIFVSRGLDGLTVLGLEFQALFNRVIAQLFAKIARAAAEFRTELANLPDDVKAVLPGVGLLEKAIGKVADGAGSIGRKFAEGAAEFSEKAKLLAEENAFTVAGLQEQINRNANQPGQGALLFDDPLSALSTSVEPLKKDIEESLRAGTADGITKGVEDGRSRALPHVQGLGEDARRELAKGVRDLEKEVADLRVRAARQQLDSTGSIQDLFKYTAALREQRDVEREILQAASVGKGVELARLVLKKQSVDLSGSEHQRLDEDIALQTRELGLMQEKFELQQQIADEEQRQLVQRLQAQGKDTTGVGGGPEFGSVTEGINELQRNANEAAQQIDQALLAALIVDPKDESKIINSFSDLLTNIQDLFKENPLGFVLTLFGGKGFFGQGQQGGTGFARGGLLDSARASRAQASAAHYAHPRGFARGGMPRPRGLDPRDRVPVWSRIGEYFIRPEAVQLYGKRFFDAVNSGALEPAPMRALASVTPGVMGRMPTVPGFAQGGAVSSLPSGGGNGPIQAVMAPDERTVAALLSAGKQTFRDWLQEEGYRPV